MPTTPTSSLPNCRADLVVERDGRIARRAARSRASSRCAPGPRRHRGPPSRAASRRRPSRMPHQPGGHALHRGAHYSAARRPRGEGARHGPGDGAVYRPRAGPRHGSRCSSRRATPAATLPAALRSLRRQTLRGLGVRAWWTTGRSTGRPPRAGAVAAADPRFAVLSTPPAGLVAALTAGLARCRGRVRRTHGRRRPDAPRSARRARSRRSTPRRDLAAVGAHVRFFPRTRHVGRPARLRALAERDRLAGARARRRLRRVPGRAPDAAASGARCWRRFGYRDRGWPEDYDLVLRAARRRARASASCRAGCSRGATARRG